MPPQDEKCLDLEICGAFIDKQKSFGVSLFIEIGNTFYAYFKFYALNFEFYYSLLSPLSISPLSYPSSLSSLSYPSPLFSLYLSLSLLKIYLMNKDNCSGSCRRSSIYCDTDRVSRVLREESAVQASFPQLSHEFQRQTGGNEIIYFIFIQNRFSQYLIKNFVHLFERSSCFTHTRTTNAHNTQVKLSPKNNAINTKDDIHLILGTFEGNLHRPRPHSTNLALFLRFRGHLVRNIHLHQRGYEHRRCVRNSIQFEDFEVMKNRKREWP